MRLAPTFLLASLAGAFSCRTATTDGSSRGESPDADSTAADPDVTYSRDIAPILAENCWGCHGENGIAFRTEGYEYAKANAALITHATAIGMMPPWPPSDTCLPLEHVRELTEEQKALIARWSELGSPEGDPTDLPELDRSDPTTADLLTGMGNPYTPIGTDDDYRCFVLDPALTEDTWVTSFQIAPGNTRMVHHVLLFTDPDDTATALDESDPGEGYTCFGDPGFWSTTLLGGWVPGTDRVETPHGTGMPLDAGDKIVMQVHYFPSNDPGGSDQTVVGLDLADEPVLSLYSIPIYDYNLDIPAGVKDHVEGSSWTNTYGLDVDMFGVTPHMHLLGSKIHVSATTPEGDETCWIEIDDWDFQYQEFYWFQDPVRFHDGDRLSIECTYDNTAGNPDNPSDPPVPVHWGEGTTDEMCLAFVTFAF
jgi:hypothetical protein